MNDMYIYSLKVTKAVVKSVCLGDKVRVKSFRKLFVVVFNHFLQQLAQIKLSFLSVITCTCISDLITNVYQSSQWQHVKDILLFWESKDS